MRVVRLIPEMQ